MDARNRYALWYLAFAFLAFAAVQSIFRSPHRDTLAYSEFRSLVRAGKVDSVVVEGRAISGVISTEGIDSILPPERAKALGADNEEQHSFITVRMEDPDLVLVLDAAGVRYTRRTGSPWVSALLAPVLPLVLLVALWSLPSRRMSPQSGIMGLGRSKANVYVQETTGVTFDDVGGVDAARVELAEIVDFLKRPERYVRLGGTIPRGALLVAPPGTGKTLLPKAVAGEAGVPFFSLTGSDFVDPKAPKAQASRRKRASLSRAVPTPSESRSPRGSTGCGGRLVELSVSHSTGSAISRTGFSSCWRAGQTLSLRLRADVPLNRTA